MAEKRRLGDWKVTGLGYYYHRATCFLQGENATKHTDGKQAGQRSENTVWRGPEFKSCFCFLLDDLSGPESSPVAVSYQVASLKFSSLACKTDTEVLALERFQGSR